MLVEGWKRNVGRKNRNLRNEICIIDKPVTRWLDPKIEIFIADPWRAKGVACGDAVGRKDRRCNLRQRAAKRVASDINRAPVLIGLPGLREGLMQRYFTDVILEGKERLVESLMDKKF